MQRSLMRGDRVKINGVHHWMPERQGTIKQIQNRVGNRYLVKFDIYELGMWHDEDGDPVLRLGDGDLLLVPADLNLAV